MRTAPNFLAATVAVWAYENVGARAARILKQRTVIDDNEFHRREAAERAAAEYEAKAAPIREERRRRKALAYARRLPKTVRAAALAALAKGGRR